MDRPPPARPTLGTEPTTWAYAPTGNRTVTSWFLGRRSPLHHTSLERFGSDGDLRGLAAMEASFPVLPGTRPYLVGICCHSDFSTGPAGLACCVSPGLAGCNDLMFSMLRKKSRPDGLRGASRARGAVSTHLRTFARVAHSRPRENSRFCHRRGSANGLDLACGPSVRCPSWDDNNGQYRFSLPLAGLAALGGEPLTGDIISPVSPDPAAP
uniref:Uncharacterized protein n=1 Tax=Myotis myotis TaxID=51298 RepID=A0A7J7RUM7_MYOMY|nr:hypothetical protein mMyoMyo1_010145 [Myotis myotis]